MEIIMRVTLGLAHVENDGYLVEPLDWLDL